MSLFGTKLTGVAAVFTQLEHDVAAFVVKEVNAVDVAVVAQLKTSFGAIFTPQVWAELKTAAGKTGSLLMHESFAVLTGQEVWALGVAHFTAGVAQIGLNSGLMPSHIVDQMVSAGKACAQAGITAAVTSADIASLKADVDKMIAMGTIPDAHAPAIVAAVAAHVDAVTTVVAPVVVSAANVTPVVATSVNSAPTA